MWERCAAAAPDEPTRASIREHLLKLIWGEAIARSRNARAASPALALALRSPSLLTWRAASRTREVPLRTVQGEVPDRRREGRRQDGTDEVPQVRLPHRGARCGHRDERRRRSGPPAAGERRARRQARRARAPARPAPPRAGPLATSLASAKSPAKPGERHAGALASAFKTAVQREEEVSAPFDMADLSPSDEWYVAINGVPGRPHPHRPRCAARPPSAR